eukprot:c25318_g2_i1 orf=97-1431(+)
MSAQSVTLLKTSTVVPTKPTERQLMYLSSLDLLFRDIIYNLRVLFYEQIGPSQYSQFVATLKQSLGEDLVHFYPLAGRLAMGEDGRFVIDCNDAGADFVEAQIDASFEELQRDHFDFKPYFAELAQLGHLTRSDLPHLPLLSIQVTQFLEGGVAVAISHSHIAMDGSSLWHFWISWSECARGLPLSKPPFHGRTSLKPEKISHEIAKLMPFEMKPTQTFNVGVTLVSKVMHFTNEALGKLKEMGIYAQSKVEGPKRRVSSLEVLFAHCWRHVTHARRLADEQELSFIVLADWRRSRPNSKTPPPVPENYFGNAVTWTSTSATPSILRNESFAATLARIADVVDECTHLDTLHGTIHWLELHDTHFDLGPMCFPGITMNVASSPRFPTHLVDYGWGSPTCARPIRVGSDGEICLFPSPNGGVDVCIKLDPQSLQCLIDDTEFLCP